MLLIWHKLDVARLLCGVWVRALTLDDELSMLMEWTRNFFFAQCWNIFFFWMWNDVGERKSYNQIHMRNAKIFMASELHTDCAFNLVPIKHHQKTCFVWFCFLLLLIYGSIYRYVCSWILWKCKKRKVKFLSIL